MRALRMHVTITGRSRPCDSLTQTLSRARAGLISQAHITLAVQNWSGLLFAKQGTNVSVTLIVQSPP
ncbi:hypothetical protein EMIT0P294_30706 [Pseudomonas sp. IT-P294]